MEEWNAIVCTFFARGECVCVCCVLARVPHFCRGLADNAEPEQFSLRYKVEDRPFPCHFIKLVPLQSWSPTFAFSIWYVELQGVTQTSIVGPAQQWLTQVSFMSNHTLPDYIYIMYIVYIHNYVLSNPAHLLCAAL